MKLLRFGEKGQEKPGLIDTDNKIRDLSAIIPDFDNKTLAQPDLITRLQSLDINSLPLIAATPRIGSCINVSGKIMCIGYNG